MDQLEVFHPERIAGRILDKGDILTLVEKARETYDATSSARLEKRIRQNEFTIEDFLESLRQFRKMGSLEDTMKMIPGMSRALKQARQNQPQEKDLKRIEAIISSMTKAEREDHAILNGSRRERIAKGSGTTVQDVNKFVNQFVETRKLMKQFNKLGVKGIMRSGMLGGR